MRRTGLIVVSAALLAWAAAALVLGSPSLDLSDSGTTASSDVSPSCLPSTLVHTAALGDTDVDVSPAPETGHRQPPHPDQLPGRAGRGDPRSLRRGPAQRRPPGSPPSLLAG